MSRWRSIEDLASQAVAPHGGAGVGVEGAAALDVDLLALVVPGSGSAPAPGVPGLATTTVASRMNPTAR